MLRLKCKAPLAQVVFSNEGLDFSPVQVDPKNFLISWDTENFRADPENSEGFFIELHTESMPIPAPTFNEISRDSIERSSPPTTEELTAANGGAVTPAAGNTTVVSLGDGTKELWTFSTEWKIERVVEANHLVLSRKVTTRTLETGESEEIVSLLFAGKSPEESGIEPYRVSPFENVDDGQSGYVVVDLPSGISSARVEFKRQTGLQ